MNINFKQFKQQAGIDYNPDQEGLDLFAKLIIEECAQRAEVYAYMSDNFNQLARELRTIK